MTELYRLAAGGRIDRDRRLLFRFDGIAYEGRAGDTLASALLANGVHHVARSFKYHRPRGILTAGSEEPNALVRLGEAGRSTPNLRATEIELFDGLAATSVNAWPSLAFDMGAINNLLSRLLVAGFYYKTFKAPKLFWDRLYEPAIRRMAGMGRAPEEADPDRYDKMHAHCDVLIVGAGPAGLAAALAAARSGARVVLADEQGEMGGSLLASRDGAALEWRAAALAELAAAEEVRLLPRTTVFGYYDQNYLCAVERRTDHLGAAAPPGTTRQRLWHFRAKRVVLATGAHERPLVFADNDRPGIMLAGAVRAYVNRYAVVPGKRGLVFTNNDSAYEAARDLADAGIEIAAVIDLRRDIRPALAEAMRRRGIQVLAGYAIVGTHGGRRLAGVDIARLAATNDRVDGPRHGIDCDFLAVSGGWSPAIHLFSQSQGRLRFDEARAAFVPGRAAQAQLSAGACNGAFTLAGCLSEGGAAGAEAARLAGFADAAPPPLPALGAGEDEAPLLPLWLVPSHRAVGRGGKKHFVDFQNDVTAADIRLAAREGFRSVEHVKRWTTAGMGTDQGKTSNVNALAILAGAIGCGIAETGTTTFRPPYTPVAFGALAGRDLGDRLDPIRVTPIHDWHVANGAIFENVGQWKRPWYYPNGRESMAEAVARECRAVREAVGILDASTLGKIELSGRDVPRLLDRVYTNAWGDLAIGSARYGLMCTDDGMVFDDGVTARLAEQRWLMSTTTGNAARVLDWLEEWLQTEWPELEVHCTSVTEHWANVTLAGPRARDVLHALAPDLALDAASFPFMTLREAFIGGIRARIVRVSFTGELSFEINVPAWHGRALWEAAMAAGAPFGITPFGTEAMHVLRAEKGYIIVGQETDGSVTPYDLGMGWAVSRKKGDFIGRRSLARSDTARAGRKQLVGLLPEDQEAVLPEGAQLVAASLGPVPGRIVAAVPMIGHVTSSYMSPTLGRAFALALVENGRARIGETVWAPLADREIAARIVAPIFYDKENRRRDG